jgi:hypothetical protein
MTRCVTLSRLHVNVWFLPRGQVMRNLQGRMADLDCDHCEVCSSVFESADQRRMCACCGIISCNDCCGKPVQEAGQHVVTQVGHSGLNNLVPHTKTGLP